jgi:ABC-type uncharacterized transport system substrate-binding protein
MTLLKAMWGAMRRREFISLLGGAAILPLVARAQERIRRIGVLMPYAKDNSEALARTAAFIEEFQRLGWTDGRNVKIEYRFDDTGDLRKTATELLKLSPEVILASATPAVAALQSGHPHRADCICGGLRSGQRRLCCQSGQARRQHHWVREF